MQPPAQAFAGACGSLPIALMLVSPEVQTLSRLLQEPVLPLVVPVLPLEETEELEAGAAEVGVEEVAVLGAAAATLVGVTAGAEPAEEAPCPCD